MGVLDISGNRDNLKRKFARMSPLVREEFLDEGKRDERSKHIEKEGEEFKTDLIPDKKFKTEIEADQEVKRIFEENPQLSNYSDLEY